MHRATPRRRRDRGRAFGDRRAAIQSGHGIFSTGQSIDEPAWWFVLMERCCASQLLAEAAGTPMLRPTDAERGGGAALGSPMFGWQSFQTLWDEIIASDPDLMNRGAGTACRQCT